MNKTNARNSLLIVYLRLIDAGTDNACWMPCAKDDHGAIEFTPLDPQRRMTSIYALEAAKAATVIGSIIILVVTLEMVLR